MSHDQLPPVRQSLALSRSERVFFTARDAIRREVSNLHGYWRIPLSEMVVNGPWQEHSSFVRLQLRRFGLVPIAAG